MAQDKRGKSTTSISRRELLRYSSAGAVLLGLTGAGSLVLTSCGTDPKVSDTKTSSPTTSGSSAAPTSKSASASAPATSSAAPTPASPVIKASSGRFLTPTPWTTSFVQDMVAKEEGYFEEFGLDLKLDQGRESATSMTEVAQRTADVTNAYGSTTLLAIGEHALPLSIVSCLRQAGQWELLSLPDKPIDNAKQLEGKSLGVYSAGGTVAQLSTIILNKAGVPLDSVQRPVAKGPSAYALAKQGEIDAWIDLDSNRARLELEFGELHVVNTDEFAPMPSAAILFNQEVVAATPELPIAYMAAMYRAVNFIKAQANWDRVAEIIAKYNRELTREDLDVTLPLLIDQWFARGEENLFDINPSKWADASESLVDAKVLEAPLDVTKYIDTSILPKAKELAGV